MLASWYCFDFIRSAIELMCSAVGLSALQAGLRGARTARTRTSHVLPLRKVAFSIGKKK
jgi:hypothetical protein